MQARNIGIWATVLFWGFAGQANSKTIDWRTDEGRKRFQESQYKADFFHLINNFESQKNKIFCGPTTAAIVLNTLQFGKEKDIPYDMTLLANDDKKYLPADFQPLFNRYTQNNIFTRSPKKRDAVLGRAVPDGKGESRSFGFKLLELYNLFKAYGTTPSLHPLAVKTDLQQIRAKLLKVLEEPDAYLVVNYDRKSLNQKGGGHISPIGAYHQKSDSFLILDVNPNKAPFVWVTTMDLVAAMNTLDGDDKRGYIIVKAGEKK